MVSLLSLSFLLDYTNKIAYFNNNFNYFLRLPAYFAEVQQVLCEFDRNKYIPETILDYGSGIGAAFWAAYEKWGNFFLLIF